MGVWGAKSGNGEKSTVKMCHEVVGADDGKWWWWWFFPFYEIQSDMRKEREFKFSSESTRISPLESRNIFRILCVLWMMMWINRKQGVLSLSLASMKIDNMELSSSLCEKYSAKTREKERERVENSWKFFESFDAFPQILRIVLSILMFVFAGGRLGVCKVRTEKNSELIF